MAIKTLDERHKRAAEELVKGTPKRHVARDLGIAPNTLYKWMDDPLWLGYFTQMLEDFEVGREQRLGTVLDAQFDLLLECIKRYRDALVNGEADGIGLPSLVQQVDAITKLANMRRVETGRPGEIMERRSEPKPDGRLHDLLDKITGKPQPRPSLPAPEPPENGGEVH